MISTAIVSRRWSVAVAALLTAIALLPGAAQGQELYTFTASAMGGLGGSLDADPGDGVDNFATQLGFSLVTETRTRLGFRLGTFDLESDERFEGLFDADLTYVTVGGEYRFTETYYESGLYLGLGGYRLEGTGFDGQGASDTGLGVVLGAVGEFPINRNFGVLLELSGHYADLDTAQVFGMIHVGVAYHW